jgi:hypothetical protein
VYAAKGIMDSNRGVGWELDSRSSSAWHLAARRLSCSCNTRASQTSHVSSASATRAHQRSRGPIPQQGQDLLQIYEHIRVSSSEGWTRDVLCMSNLVSLLTGCATSLSRSTSWSSSTATSNAFGCSRLVFSRATGPSAAVI